MQTFGSSDRYNLDAVDPKIVSYDHIERNAWHEPGHALDWAALNGFSRRQDFLDAIQDGERALLDAVNHGKLTEAQLKWLNVPYYLDHKVRRFLLLSIRLQTAGACVTRYSCSIFQQ